MSKSSPRESASDWAARKLREGLLEGRWRVELPGEVTLCTELDVSRMTLRKAVEQLAREGWLELGGRGRHHRIVREQTVSLRAPSGRTIRILTPLTIAGSVMLNALSRLASRVAPAGFRVEMEHHPHLFEGHHPRALERLTRSPDTAGWLLLYATESMQQWFARSGHPCVICGRPYEGVLISSVQPKPDVIGQHAVGRFYAHGHRELVYLTSEVTSLSDTLIAKGFQEEAKRLGVSANVIRHKNDPESLRTALEEILSSTSHPTGIMSSCAAHCIAALCQSLRTRWRVPEDVSIISGWHDSSLDYTIPTIAHYNVDGAKLGDKLAKVFLELFENGPGKVRTFNVVPEFVPGGSLSYKE